VVGSSLLYPGTALGPGLCLRYQTRPPSDSTEYRGVHLEYSQVKVLLCSHRNRRRHCAALLQYVHSSSVCLLYVLADCKLAEDRGSPSVVLLSILHSDRYVFFRNTLFCSISKELYQ